MTADVEPLKLQIATMTERMSNMSDAHEKNTRSMTELNVSIRDMIVSLKERDVEDKYLRQMVEQDRKEHRDFLDEYLPSIKVAKSKQEKRGRLIESMQMNWAKILGTAVVAVVIAGLAATIGVDLKSLLSIK